METTENEGLRDIEVFWLGAQGQHQGVFSSVSESGGGVGEEKGRKRETEWEGDNESQESVFRIRLLALNADFDIHRLNHVE